MLMITRRSMLDIVARGNILSGDGKKNKQVYVGFHGKSDYYYWVFPLLLLRLYVFPNTYNLGIFKSQVNRFLLGSLPTTYIVHIVHYTLHPTS